MSVRLRPEPIFLLGAALVLLSSSAKAQKPGEVTLQILPADSGAQPGAPLLLAPGQRVWVKLKAVDARGRAIDLKETPVAWQSSNLDLVQVRGKGTHAVAVGTAPGQVTITATALEQTAALTAMVGSSRLVPSQPVTDLEPVRSPAPIRSSPPIDAAAPVVPMATVSAPVAVAKLDASRLATRDLPTRDLCASGTPDPSLGQPCIRQVLPDSGAEGMAVSIKGSGFTNTLATVGGIGGSVQSDTLILVRLARAPNGDGVSVTNKTSGRSSSAPFKAIQPHILDFSPKTGRAGDRLIISGFGFGDSQVGVMFANGHNPAASAVVDGSGTLVNAYVPPGDVTGKVMVNGMTSTAEFVELPTFLPPSPAEVFIPPTGSVILQGKAMQNINQVMVGSAPAPIVSKDYTRLIFQLPPNLQTMASSFQLQQPSVSYPNGSGGYTLALAGPTITVTVAPQITALEPDSGTACDQVMIRGKALINDPRPTGNTSPTVAIGAVASPYASGSNSQISFFVPKMASSGPVTVKGYNQTVSSSAPFRIVTPRPTAYPQGGSVSIGQRAQYVGRLLEVTKVSFTGGVELTQGWTVGPIYNDGSCQDLLEVPIPAGAKTGPVTFTNPTGTVTSSINIVQ